MAVPGPVRRLNERMVIDAALDVVRGQGFAALSIRSVAGVLGVSPNAIYTYVPDRAGLLRGMVEQLIAAIDLNTLSLPTLSPAERVVEFAVDARRTLLAHPGSAELIMSGPIDGPHALRLNEALLNTLLEAGLNLDDAARGAYALQVFVLGAVMLEAVEGSDGDSRTENALAGARRSALDLVDVSAVPLTGQTADLVARYHTEGQFRWGVQRLVDGMTATS